MRRIWTDSETALLTAMYPHCHTADVAAWVGRPVGQCYQGAARHGLHKTAEYLASDSAMRIQRGRQNEQMIASRFKPGLIPWNRGSKGTTGLHENCRRTQFKPGSRTGAAARNYLPIGSLRICADGYLEQKMTDDQAIVPARRWTAVHRIVWEQAYGPIPAGYIVRFKSGQKTTVLEKVTVDRLECITRAENARRNSVAIRSPELAKLFQLKGAITRQVNRIAREAQEQRA